MKRGDIITGEKFVRKPGVRNGAVAILLLLCLVPGIMADDYVGGDPPVTVQTGTVSGGLYVDATLDFFGSEVNKTFSDIPDASDIAWARLYVVVYCGTMQSNYDGRATVSFDGDGDGTFETPLGREELNVEYVYEYDGGTTPVVVNDHCNRVTSDYLMWYNVTSLISSRAPKARVATTKVHSSFDGRIKMLTLFVAYNDGDSDKVRYWVNQGHDVDSFFTDDAGNPYAGMTTFDLTGLSGRVESATLLVNHLASTDGTYAWNGDAIPADPPDGNYQGVYFGTNTWNVTSQVLTGDVNDLTYDRNASFYKIPLATLEVVMEGEPPVDIPVAGFTADTISGTAPLTVHFTDLSTNTPTSWAWDFDTDGTVDSSDRNPIHTYYNAGTCTVKLTASNSCGSDEEIKVDYITVTAAPACDLTPSLVNPDTGNVFAKEPNRVRINVKNNGLEFSPETEVRLTSTDGVDVREIVPAIAAGAIVPVYVIDPTIRTTEGGIVTYTAIVDPDDMVSETDEANNAKAGTAKTVKFNGYKGKRYWDDSDVTTKKTFDLRGGILHSSGDSAYMAGGIGRSGWSSYTVTWTSGDLPLPEGATLQEARLYVPYTWDDTSQIPDHLDITFNGITAAPQNHYQDRSNFGGYPNHDYGLLTYDVTGLFNPSGNSAVISKDDVNTNVAMYGLTLAVVYADPDATRKQIFLNEEFDLLGADATGYATTPGEATAYVPFSGMTIDPGDAVAAKLVTFVPSGNGPEGDLLFNGATIASRVWDNGITQVAVDTHDVVTSLLPSGNEAAIRSTSGSTPVMAASHAFLIIEYIDAAPVADFEAEPRSGEAPLTVRFTDTSTGYITHLAWDFDNDGTTDSTDESPDHEYALSGTYTVKLTVTGPGGSDDEVKTDYITVTAVPALSPLPGYTNLPQDPDGDGLFEDVNGDSIFSFGDIRTFFEYYDAWIPANEPGECFDYDNNSMIGFGDVRALFTEWGT
ncbi:MAG: hypothetical protein APR53_02965 [Methanoculleus sp. SDB]|nr:MAG: hypothetical protein APR53_02965 [Methanoculleus sp. SDB]